MGKKAKVGYEAVKRLQKKGWNLNETARLLNSTRSEVTEVIKKYFEKVLRKYMKDGDGQWLIRS